MVGLAHVVLGALSLGTGIFGLVFAVNGVGMGTGGLIANGLLLVSAVMTVLAGLWIRDGRRAGALLALPIDGLRVVLALVAPAGSLLDLVASVALLGGVLWVLPTLGGARDR